MEHLTQMIAEESVNKEEQQDVKKSRACSNPPKCWEAPHGDVFVTQEEI